MRSFAAIDQLLGSVPGPLVMRLSRIDTGRGREQLYRDQLPQLLTELAARARVASITASSALEGVVVADEARARQIIDGRAATLRNRSEQEFSGYRAALDYLFTSNWRPLNVGLLLHLHRLLWSETTAAGGSFKTDDNLVVDRSPDGSAEIRFVPTPARLTPEHTEELVDRYNGEVGRGVHHPILLIGLFVLDLLTIHPFADGNGRVVRALTNALLDDAGYGAGKYVSLEHAIAATADDYYSALLASTHGWHDRAHDPWPWLTYFVSTMATVYDTFESRASSDRSTGTKQDRVRDHVLNHASEIFRISDIRVALPGISDPTIRLALETLKQDGRVAPEGVGRSAVWRKSAP
ncbi:MAG: Fic family protein [Phycicoccus sp.]